MKNNFCWNFDDVVDDGPTFQYIIEKHELNYNHSKKNQIERLPLELIGRIFKLKQQYEINELLFKIKNKKLIKFIINDYCFKRYIHASDEWPFLFLVTYSNNIGIFPEVSHCQFKKVTNNNIKNILNRTFENFKVHLKISRW